MKRIKLRGLVLFCVQGLRNKNSIDIFYVDTNTNRIRERERICINMKSAEIQMRIRKIFPGLVVCIMIAIISKFIGQYIPSLGAATISIFLGILIGNTIGKHDILNKGTKFAESTLLSVSVVLLGATLKISALLNLGIRGILFIVLQMTITIIGVLLIGKAMNFPQDFTLLMASGNSVCGSSAIASTAPVIHAHSKDKGIAITMVNVTGTVLMLLLPVLTSFLFSNELNQTSALLGGILQSVGQVVAAGSMVSEDVKELATIYKIVRIIFLVAVVFILGGIKNNSKGELVNESANKSDTGRKYGIRIPWYIIGFFITCGIYSFSLITDNIALKVKEIDNFIEIIALAGIGMRVSITDLLKQGAKTSLYCLFISIVQIMSAILLIWILL